MDLVTVRELYKNPEKFLDKEITVGGWIRSLRDSRHSVSSLSATEPISRHFRLFTTTLWKTSLRFPN